MDTPRWKVITPSSFEWERRGLDFVRQGLPNHDPYLAWSNFEFVTREGAIYEVDLLVLTKMGFWLVEIKSFQGRVGGDAGTWTIDYGGKRRSIDNPALLANRKAKALGGLLKSQPALGKFRLPWLDALVFLSDEGVQCDLTGNARNKILLRDHKDPSGRTTRDGIVTAMMQRVGPGIDPDPRGTIDSRLANALSRAMEQAGIRPSQASRKIGDYILDDLLVDGPGYQERLARHSTLENVFCRIRQYQVAQAADEPTRVRLKRAAEREFHIIRSLDHKGILQVQDYKEHENGPALLFRYLDPTAIRLDHFLAANGSKLTADQRMGILRQIADAIRYAHRNRVIHRALGPQSVLVTRADEPIPTIQVFNWQLGIREPGGTSAVVTNVEDMVESLGLVYMAPEALADQRKVSEASDVFSLGAIAFNLFANRPPAENITELSHRLREHKGLLLSSVVDGVGQKLDDFIKWSTHPDVLTRISSVEDFLSLLDEVEDELTAPDETHVTDPLQAKRGDKLDHGYIVERILGKGATATAFLVRQGDQEYVLKVAHTDADNGRLRDEAKALRAVHSEFVVALHEELEMAGRTVLVLQKAGDKTLAKELRETGVPTLDLLARYGDDLMSALETLERHGVAHRDIKPDNIGIRSLTKQRNQLIVFDFSLAGAPLDNIRLGTPSYLDPFLPNRRPQRWDLAAERYAAGVTLYEMTLGAGVLPQWGHGKSAEAVTDDELVIEAEKFDASVRDGMVRFFKKALHREPKQRFDNAEEMRREWARIFEDAEKSQVQTPTGEVVELSIALEQVDLKTPISALGVSNRGRNALERANLLTVRDLLLHPVGELHLMRGVGNKTRKEIIEYVTRLRERFPDVASRVEKPAAPTDGTAEGPVTLEVLANRVQGSPSSRAAAEGRIRTALLRLDPGDPQPPENWPSQSEVAVQAEITRARVGQVLTADRKRWAKDPLITQLRHDLHEQLLRMGGVATVAETFDLVLLLRPATTTEKTADQRRLASAVARAVVETEGALENPRYQLRRIDGRTLVACSQELVVYARKLGQLADELAEDDPLPPPLRVFKELFGVAQPALPPGCQPPTNERLIHLAAALSDHAAVSSRQELYPRGMAADRTLRLGLGALTGLGIGGTGKGFTVEDIRSRLESRYPEAAKLPDRPELDALLEKVGLDVKWDADENVYRRPRSLSPQVTSGSSIPDRLKTATHTRLLEVTPEMAEARQVEERLQHAAKDGGFLVLTVQPKLMRRCEGELLDKFPVNRVSFDDLLLRHLRTQAEEHEVGWAVIENADGTKPGSQDWKNLLHLVSLAAPKIEDELLRREEQLLLVNPGLIARYDLMSLLENLRDKAGHEARCPGVWVLVPTDGQSDMPFLDHAEIPLITPGQRARVSEHWINNLHRGKPNETALNTSLEASGK